MGDQVEVAADPVHRGHERRRHIQARRLGERRRGQSTADHLEVLGRVFERQHALPHHPDEEDDEAEGDDADQQREDEFVDRLDSALIP